MKNSSVELLQSRIAALEKTLEEKNDVLERMKREQEIEGALEKVRSRTMAMQHSSELTKTFFIG